MPKSRFKNQSFRYNSKNVNDGEKLSLQLSFASGDSIWKDTTSHNFRVANVTFEMLDLPADKILVLNLIPEIPEHGLSKHNFKMGLNFSDFKIC